MRKYLNYDIVYQFFGHLISNPADIFLFKKNKCIIIPFQNSLNQRFNGAGAPIVATKITYTTQSMKIITNMFITFVYNSMSCQLMRNSINPDTKPTHRPLAGPTKKPLCAYMFMESAPIRTGVPVHENGSWTGQLARL